MRLFIVILGILLLLGPRESGEPVTWGRIFMEVAAICAILAEIAWQSVSLFLWKIVSEIFIFIGRVLHWFNPTWTQEQTTFSEELKELLLNAYLVEVHRTELFTPGEKDPEPKRWWRSLKQVRIDTERTCRTIARSLIQANREGSELAKCLDAEYVLCIESKKGRAEMLFCFHCGHVKVSSEELGVNKYFPISWRPRGLFNRLLRWGMLKRLLRRWTEPIALTSGSNNLTPSPAEVEKVTDTEKVGQN